MSTGVQLLTLSQIIRRSSTPVSSASLFRRLLSHQQLVLCRTLYWVRFTRTETLTELLGTLTPLLEYINTTWLCRFTINYNTHSYPGFYLWWSTAFPSDFGVGAVDLLWTDFLMSMLACNKEGSRST